MVYDEHLAGRVRQQLANTPALTELKMFGGLCFMLKGNMCCGILNNNLIVRVSVEDYASLFKQPNTKVFDFTGKSMRGFMVRHRCSIRINFAGEKQKEINAFPFTLLLKTYDIFALLIQNIVLSQGAWYKSAAVFPASHRGCDKINEKYLPIHPPVL